jgi:hypothetical protein
MEIDMDQARIDSIQADLDRVYADDQMKPVCAPFSTLGKEMIDRLPKVDGKILVLSDLGLLAALLQRLHAEGQGFDNVTFVAHTQEQQLFSQNLGVGKTVQVGYNDPIKELERQLMGLKFDIVVGNPPYQGKKSGGGDGSGNAIWQHFVTRSFDLLADGGFMSFVHPNAWRFGPRKKMQKAQQILFRNQLIFARLQFPFPGAGVMVDWYVLQKAPVSQLAKIKFVDEIAEIEWNIDNFHLMNFNNKLVRSIFSKVCTIADNGLKTRQPWGGLTILDESVNGEFKFAHGSEHTQIPPKWKIKPHPHIHQYKPKVIFCATRQFRAFIDSGEIGIGDHLHYLLENDPMRAGFIKSVADSKLMAFLQGQLSQTFFDYKSWSQWNNPQPLKQIELVSKGELSDEQIFCHFNLSQEEIDLIHRTLA